MSKILVTGGAGYIGGHTVLELLKAHNEVVVVDNLCNSSSESLKKIEKITGKKITFYPVDLLDAEALDKVFSEASGITAVIHFAGLKAVGESTTQPLCYYQNNIAGALNLFQAMKKCRVKKLVFSSSATVYGIPKKNPLKEDAPLGPTNPYGHSKQMLEQILLDTARAENWHLCILRYFNPVGAHESGLIGEDPKYPNNLAPFLTQVAAGLRKELVIFGNDWPTPDGTGVRDYIHVVDLAQGHLKALAKIAAAPGPFIYNLGTGQGISVLEMVKTLEKIIGRPIPIRMGERREGDVAEVVACPRRAQRELNWRAEQSPEEMLASAWKWQTQGLGGP